MNESIKTAATTGNAITAILNLHREDTLSVPAIRSYLACGAAASSHGFRVERIAVLDRANTTTRRCLDGFAAHFDRIEVVDFGDLGASRNHGVNLASGKYVAFFDGDDLWGEEWLTRAARAAQTEPDLVAYHPECIFFFSADDFAIQSSNETPHAHTRSHFFLHTDSNAADFDPRSILFTNTFTAHSFGQRELFLQHPYILVDRARGFAFEDWEWNARTLSHGIRHAVVAETVHVIRIKGRGSLGTQVTAEGLLPPLREAAKRLLGWS